MIKSLEAVSIGSKNAQKLADFYKKIVGLKLDGEFEFGKNQKGFMFKAGRDNIYITDEPKVKGKNKNPQQIFFNLEVDNIEKEVARLKRAKIKPVNDIFHMEGYGLIATFKDVDGNHFQLVQVKAN